MKKCFVSLLFVMAYNIMKAQQSSEDISGVYYLEGVMETASIIELKADSSFDFFYSYGAIDRSGSGKWALINHEIILNGRARPTADLN